RLLEALAHELGRPGTEELFRAALHRLGLQRLTDNVHAQLFAALTLTPDWVGRTTSAGGGRVVTGPAPGRPTGALVDSWWVTPRTCHAKSATTTPRSARRGAAEDYSVRRWKPPSTSITAPVLNGSRSVAIATTARPTSSGSPQRRMGVRPSRISASYRSATGRVMSVATMPGRTSYTLIPCSASLAAYSLVSIARPALARQ